MNDESLTHILSTVVLSYLTPEALGTLIVLNKRFKEVFERHEFWKRAVTLYFPKAFLYEYYRVSHLQIGRFERYCMLLLYLYIH